MKMTDVETNWKRSRKAEEEEEGPALLEEKAVGGGGRAGQRDADAGTSQLIARSQGLVVI